MSRFDWSKHIMSLEDYPPLKQQWESDLVDGIKSAIPKKPGMKVLEVGCSNGRWLRWFAKEYGCEAYGIDLNAAGFKRDLINVRGDAIRLPYRDKSFDVVFSLGLIEHFPRHNRFSILKEQARLLSDGGYLICNLPNLWLSIEYLWIKYFYDYKQGFKYYIVKRDELDKTFGSLGLKTEHFAYTGVFKEKGFIKRLKEIGLRRFFSSEMLYICKKY